MMSSTYAGFMASPPIQEDVVMPDNKFTDVWKNHFNSISDALGLVLIHDRFVSSGQEVPITVVVTMTTANRNDLDNAVNSSIIYNIDTDRFNFKQASGWVTFAPIPA